MVRRRHIPTWQKVLGTVAIALVSGLATYVIGGTPAQEAGSVTLDASADPSSSLQSEVVLKLDWGTAEDEVWPGALETPCRLEACFPVNGDRFVVVDHPDWHAGARVRWMTPDGTVTATHLTSPGATLFTSDGSGVLYVLAKGASPSEQVVQVAPDGSVEATYTVPLNANSGAVVRWQGDLWAQVGASVADLQAGTLELREALIPVSDQGGQVNDVDAAASRTEGWRIGEDGTLYVRSRTSDQLGSEKITQELGASGAPLMRIPDRAIPAGVTDATSLVLVIPGDDGTLWRRTLAGWPTASPGTAQLVWGRFDGSVLSRAVIPWSSLLSGIRDRVIVREGAAYVLDADERGVTLTRFGVRDE